MRGGEALFAEAATKPDRLPASKMRCCICNVRHLATPSRSPRPSNKSRFRLLKLQIASSTMTTFALALLHDSNAEPE
jgi:hypothetical protein